MRVLITRRLPSRVEARATRDHQATLNPSDIPLTGVEIAEAAHGHDAILCCAGDKMGADTIHALPDDVRAIATFSVGTDHIDLEAARARGLIVTNTPGAVTEPTADIAMLLILAACRRASEGERMLRAGEWTGWAPTQLLGWHLAGRRLGIVGMGRIGVALAKRALAFGLKVAYHNRRRSPEGDALGLEHVADADALLARSDILSLNFPATADTRHWLDARRVALLPPGAIVVNTARGAVVDDAALIAAVSTGHVAAIGLDVFNDEPNLHQGYLGLPGAVLLPHLGTATIESREAMGFMALENLDAIARGEEPPNKVA